MRQEIKTSAGTVRMDVHGEGGEGDKGSGRGPIVLLHANLHDRHDYDLVVERLARGRQVFAVDWPGHGESDPLPDGVDAGGPLFADVLEEVVEELELRPAVFVGNSVGGYAAARLALRRPDRVAGLVLANTGGFYAPAGFGRQLCRLLGTPAVARRVQRGFIPNYMKSATDNDRAVQARAVARSKTREGAAVAAAIWRSFLDPAYNLADEAGKITAETLLVWGAKDPVLPLREGRRVQGLIPGSTLSVLQTGHVTFSSDPEGFLAAVEPFLERITG